MAHLVPSVVLWHLQNSARDRERERERERERKRERERDGSFKRHGGTHQISKLISTMAHTRKYSFDSVTGSRSKLNVVEHPAFSHAVGVGFRIGPLCFPICKF